jgi:phage shock protein E
MSEYRRPTQIIYALMVVLAILLITPVMAGGGDPAVAEKAWPMLQNGALLVDVRTEKEFADGHMDDAVNIEWDKTNDLIAAIGDDKQRQVVFYCRSGNRAGKAKAVLEGKGYNHIFNATGFSALRATEPVN